MKSRCACLLILLAAVPCGWSNCLRVGFTESYFSGLNQDEAMSAMTIWFESIIRRRGYTLESEAIIYPNKEQMADALRNAEVDIIVAHTPATIYLNDIGLVEPQFISQRNGREEEKYLLLVRRDRAISSISDLHRKSVIMQTNPRTSLLPAWFELLLQDAEGSGTVPNVTAAAKASKVVLPVFFRQADACLVSRNGYNTLTELNPQLGQELRILKESPGYVSSAICLRKNFDSALLDDVLQGLAELHLDPHGRQVLMLFKIDALIPYEDHHMENVKTLLQQISSVPAALPRRTGRD